MLNANSLTLVSKVSIFVIVSCKALVSKGTNLDWSMPCISAPSFLPNGILNNFTVGIFIKAWFAKSPSILEGELQTINSFFYPLDGINNWNRIYGPNGFFQYQFVIPDNQAELIPKIINSLREIGVPSFLTVL